MACAIYLRHYHRTLPAQCSGHAMLAPPRKLSAFPGIISLRSVVLFAGLDTALEEVYSLCSRIQWRVWPNDPSFLVRKVHFRWTADVFRVIQKVSEVSRETYNFRFRLNMRFG